MKRRHPSPSRLEQWLDGDDDAAIDEHLESCDECATVVEHLAGDDGPIETALRQVLEPPPGLRERLEGGISARLQTRQDLGVLTDMLGIGVQTARLMMNTASESLEETGPSTDPEGSS